MDSSLFPIASGNIFTADKNLAVFGKLEFTARENLADGALRRKVQIPKRIAAAQISKFLKHGVDQRIEHAWNGDQSCGAFSLDGSDDFRGIAGSLENDHGSKERRNEQCHELAEDMAHRNERDETQWVKPAFVLTIVIDAAFERLQVRQKITVG